MSERFDGTKRMRICNLPIDAEGQIVSQHNSFVDAVKLLSPDSWGFEDCMNFVLSDFT